MLQRQIKKNEMGGACSIYGGEVRTGFQWGKLRERELLEDPGVGFNIILRWMFKKWTELFWLRTGADGGLL
jgi:hypothetical protein